MTKTELILVAFVAAYVILDGLWKHNIERRLEKLERALNVHLRTENE